MIRPILLSDLLSGLRLEGRYHNGNLEKGPGELLVDPLPILQLTQDSREVKPGSLFFATKGSKVDGRSYISKATRQGAVAVIADIEGFDILGNSKIGIPIFFSKNCRETCAFIASRFFENPSLGVLTLGITGTNGKTSVSWILAQALARLGKKTTYLGTLGFQVLNDPLKTSGHNGMSPTHHTTPDAIALNSFLALAKSEGANAHVLEVSSHALAQKRTSGIHWDTIVFTNVTRDHLDYHGSMEDYAQTKLRLFTQDLLASNKSGKVAVVNIDDPIGKGIVDQLKAIASGISLVTYSPKGDHGADVFVTKREGSIAHTRIETMIFGEAMVFSTRFVGDYNIANVLAAGSCLVAQGISPTEVAHALQEVPTVPGRLELVTNSDISIFVDYAHTPDGLTNVQRSLLPLTSARLITVFGCGGERDRGKRPLMGESVRKWSDYAIVTSDNPRSESPDEIIGDILPGLAERPSGGFENLNDFDRKSLTFHQGQSGRIKDFRYVVIVDRREAIAHALEQARPGDVVLIAGKGHEDYQEINGKRYPFRDQDVVAKVLAERVDREFLER